MLDSGFLRLLPLIALVACSSNNDLGPAPDRDAGPEDGAAGDAARPPSGFKRVFVTSGAYPSSFGETAGGAAGLAAADQKCTLAAEGAVLGGTWKAWLSARPTTNAIDRIADVGPWYLVDGSAKVFNNKANLTSVPLTLISLDEQGNEISGAPDVWTGTAVGGTAKVACAWGAYNDSTATTTSGWPTVLARDWTDTGRAGSGQDSLRCSSTARLICFEQ